MQFANQIGPGVFPATKPRTDPNVPRAHADEAPPMIRLDLSVCDAIR